MTPPNISFRKKSPLRFVVPAVIAVVVIGGGLAYIGSRGESPAKKKPEQTPQIAFNVTAFQIQAEGAPIGVAAAQPERDALTKLLTDYYQAAFVDPKQWSDPQFTSLQASFTPEAKATFQRDITSLTIGEGRADFARVVPTVAELKMSIYYDKAKHVQFAIAAVHFTARATTKSKRPVDVVQDGTYRLQKTSAGWQIFSYQVKSSQDTPSPSPSPSPGGTPS
jgi:hypothetical protein